MRASALLSLVVMACVGANLAHPEQRRSPAEFTPPSEADRRLAIGDTEDPAFDPRDFRGIRAPEPGDWLAEHRERPQSFDAFVESRPNVPTKARRTIYLVPLGSLDTNTSILERYTRAYYTLPVEWLDTIGLAELDVTSRRVDRKKQLLTPDILRHLKTIVPKDAYALIALTDVDLYPDPSWNFVFGQASLRDRVGVYSFARYDHYDKKRVRRRQLKLMVHELAHIFGVGHCVHFECVVNGSNNMDETDARPLHLCPVELRKLQWSIGFDPADRYRKLLEFYRDTGLDTEAEWVLGRLRTLGSG